MTELTRRALVKGAVATGTALGTGSVPVAVASAGTAMGQRDRGWVGPTFWANRLQDWRFKDGWIECTRSEAQMEARTVGLLTREIVAGLAKATLSAVLRADTTDGRGGFGGFLIGIGGGQLHYLQAAMAQRGSGGGGGFFAVVDADGQLSFRDHTDNARPVDFAVIQTSEHTLGQSDLGARDMVLQLDIEPATQGYDCHLTLRDVRDGTMRAHVVRRDVAEAMVLGGLSLVSSPPSDGAGARFRFRDVTSSGAKIPQDDSRAIGPCLACLHSLANGTLKLSAHFVLLGTDDPKQAILEARRSGNSRWRKVAVAEIGVGFAALFRVERWDDTLDHEFRVRYAMSGPAQTVYSGLIRRDPVHSDQPLVIAMQGCVLSTQHELEDLPVRKVVAQERTFGRYEPENFNFPHLDLVRNTLAHNPDIVVFSGDQYYEQNPTRTWNRKPDTDIDTLYRWMQFLVSFRNLTRDRPAIVQVDDHDVLQGNLWGNGGRDAPAGDQNQGGYAFGKKLVQMVYRMQCGHNPDADDPTPVENDIPVSYGAFLYGGVSFGIIEDRKWKTSAVQGEDMDVHVAHLLGPRQETFLAKWKHMHVGAPKVMLTQSVWACVQTNPAGLPLADFDSNGYPPLARRRAVALAREVGCVMLSNDQHLPSLVRLGVDTHTDGPIQFTGPAGGTFWQRWFEPGKLPHRRGGDPNTGDFRDAFDNPIRVLAVANPKISFAEFRKANKTRSQAIKDRALKSEGYGIVRVDRIKREFTFECWRYDAGPADPDGQYAGWPLKLGFDEV